MCGHYYPVVPLPVLLAKPYSLITDRFVSLTRHRSVDRREQLLGWRRGLILSSCTQFNKTVSFHSTTTQLNHPVLRGFLTCSPCLAETLLWEQAAWQAGTACPASLWHFSVASLGTAHLPGSSLSTLHIGPAHTRALFSLPRFGEAILPFHQ